MDAARLQTKVSAGYAKSAARIGYAFTVYRPSAATNPIVSGNIVGGPINAAFTPRAAGFNFEITSNYTQPLFHGLFDATSINVGDYLVCTGHGTYFVIGKPDLAPNLCVECNNVISVLRPQGASGYGVSTSYIGDTPATETPLLTAWPASVIYEARGKNSGAQMPLDDVKPYFVILLPALHGVDIRTSDIIVDANSPARRYLVTASELSPYGWRMLAQLAVT